MAITKLPEPTNRGLDIALGKDFFLEVNTAATEANPTWTVVGGQRSTALKRTADEIDASHKTSGGWKSTLPGLRSWSMESEAIIIMSDLGAEALAKAFHEGKLVHCRFKSAGGKIGYVGWASITDFSLDTGHTDVATLSITLNGNGPLEEVTITA